MDTVVDEFVKLMLQALAPVIAGAAVAVLALVFKKLGLQISAEQTARTEKIVHDAIFLAEERAAAAVKRGLTPALSKASTAVNHIVEKVPGITPTEAEQLIKQELPKLGLGASGFSRALVVAATNETK